MASSTPRNQSIVEQIVLFGFGLGPRATSSTYASGGAQTWGCVKSAHRNHGRRPGEEMYGQLTRPEDTHDGDMTVARGAPSPDV